MIDCIFETPDNFGRICVMLKSLIMHVMMSVVMASCNDHFMNMFPKNVVIKWTYRIVVDDHKSNKIETNYFY